MLATKTVMELANKQKTYKKKFNMSFCYMKMWSLRNSGKQVDVPWKCNM